MKRFNGVRRSSSMSRPALETSKLTDRSAVPPVMSNAAKSVMRKEKPGWSAMANAPRATKAAAQIIRSTGLVRFTVGLAAFVIMLDYQCDVSVSMLQKPQLKKLQACCQMLVVLGTVSSEHKNDS